MIRKIYKLMHIAGSKGEAEKIAKAVRSWDEIIRVITYPSSYRTPFGMHPRLHPCGLRDERLDKTYYCLYERHITYKTYEEEDRAMLLWRRRNS